MSPDDMGRLAVVIALFAALNLIPWAIKRLSRKDHE